MKIHFLGANRQVTGSRYLLEAGGLRLLIDCGMFQERQFQSRNWEDSPVPPGSIDYLLVTHAHLDHIGLIPRLVAQGFQRPIVTVEPSVELAGIVLLDAGHLQEEEAAYKKKRHRKERRKGRYPEVPLYTQEDAKKALPLFEGVPYRREVRLNGHVTATFHEAGHILGSACVVVEVEDKGGNRKRVVFSGDLGQWDKPLLNDPELIGEADFLVMESTYGDRNHKDAGPVGDQLETVINNAARRGGNLVIPTFAVERAQELLYHIGNLQREKRIPGIPVYLDSPMAVDVTGVFRRYCAYLDEESRCRVGRGNLTALSFDGLKLVRSAEDSKKLNELTGPNIIMASSGMCTGGRIKHHLKYNIARPESTVLFVGYQAEGTLGRQITNGHTEVRIHGRNWPVRAQVAKISGLSAHGDRDDLLRWLGGFRKPPARLFLTHGEERAARSLASRVAGELGWTVEVPDYDRVEDLS